MVDTIESWFALYEESPSLVLFDNLVTEDNGDVDELLRNRATDIRHLNPIEVVIESFINIISEGISKQTVTSSEDKVLITSSIRSKATHVVVQMLRTVSDQELSQMHERWLRNLIAYLEGQKDKGDLKRDELIYLVSERFRISGNSATKAISSICTPSFERHVD